MAATLVKLRALKNCFAASATEEKSVAFVPLRTVRRLVIVRSLEWMRMTAALRPLADTCVLVGATVLASAGAVADLSSTSTFREAKGR